MLDLIVVFFVFGLGFIVVVIDVGLWVVFEGWVSDVVKVLVIQSDKFYQEFLEGLWFQRKVSVFGEQNEFCFKFMIGEEIDGCCQIVGGCVIFFGYSVNIEESQFVEVIGQKFLMCCIVQFC